MTGRTAIVTGANSGIGRAAARVLAGAGAHVVLAVRDTDKGEAAAATMPGETEVRRLDLADLASIREFAAGWAADVSLLINNAGVMVPPLSRTADARWIAEIPKDMPNSTMVLGRVARTSAYSSRPASGVTGM